MCALPTISVSFHTGASNAARSIAAIGTSGRTSTPSARQVRRISDDVGLADAVADADRPGRQRREQRLDLARRRELAVRAEWNTSLYGHSPSARAITFVWRNQAHSTSGPTR